MVCLVAVVVWELRQKEPVIDFHMLKERNFALATVSMLVLGFVLYGSTTLLPLFLQTLLGYTAMLSGLVLSPGGIVICVCMPLVGMLLRKLPGALAGDFRRHQSPSLGLMRDVALHPARSISPPRSGAAWCRASGWPSCSSPSAPWPSLHCPRAHQLRHRPLQPGAQYRRQLGHRHRHHAAGAARAVSPGGAGIAHDALRRGLPRGPGQGHAGRPGQRLELAAMPPRRRRECSMARLLKQSSMLAFADAFWMMGVLFLLIIPLMFLMRKTAPVRGPIVVE